MIRIPTRISGSGEAAGEAKLIESAMPSVTTAQFVAAAEKAANKDLSGFFQEWLFGTTAPKRP